MVRISAVLIAWTGIDKGDEGAGDHRFGQTLEGQKGHWVGVDEHGNGRHAETDIDLAVNDAQNLEVNVQRCADISEAALGLHGGGRSKSSCSSECSDELGGETHGDSGT